jgi:hypothetical protein
MTRYKGRASLKLIESKFPHHVDMMVPEGGFGRLLNAMHDWQRRSRYRGRARPEPARERTRYIRWCFADLVTAALFQKEFGTVTESGTNPEKSS